MSENEREDEEDQETEEDKEDVAWLLARERGEPGPIVSEATAARYAQLQSLITDLPAVPVGATPDVGWEQDVLAAIDAAEAEAGAPSHPAPVRSIDHTTDHTADRTAERGAGHAAPERSGRRRRRWTAAAAIFAIAAGVAIVLVVYRHSGGGGDEPVAAPTIASVLEPVPRPHRSPDPSTGDTLIVRGVVEGPGELRVYDAAGVEQARCAVPAPDCTVDRSGKHTTLRLAMLLRVPGMLRAVLFAAPLGGQHGGLDADLEAAMHAGIARTPRDLVEVQ